MDIIIYIIIDEFFKYNIVIEDIKDIKKYICLYKD